MVKRLAELITKGRIETIYSLKIVKILRRVLRKCYHSDSHERLLVDASMKKSLRMKSYKTTRIWSLGESNIFAIFKNVRHISASLYDWRDDDASH